MKLMINIIYLILALNLISCSDSNLHQSEFNDPQDSPNAFLSDQNQIVSDLEAPIEGAVVLIGFDIDNPYKGNVTKSNGKGFFRIPPEVKRPLPLTISIDGYITKTFQNHLQMPRIIKLSVQPDVEIKISGKTTGYTKVIDRDGFIDFAFVVPAVSKSNFLNFNLAQFVSPQLDTIKLPMGKKGQIPSNFAMPKQREKKFLFNIKLNKPEYTSFVQKYGTHTLFANRGRFDLNKVFDDMRAKKPILSILKHFNFTSGGKKVITVLENTSANNNISVESIRFDKKVTALAPKFSKKFSVVGVSLYEEDGLLFPVDFKNLTSNKKTTLNSANKPNKYVLYLLAENETSNKKKPYSATDDLVDLALRKTFPNPFDNKINLTKISFAITDASKKSSAPTLLPHIAEPNINKDFLNIQPPKLTGDLSSLGAVISLTESEQIKDDRGNPVTEKQKTLWNYFTYEWSSKYRLPRIKFTRDPKKIYRWEVKFLATDSQDNNDNPYDFSNATHVTRNAKTL